MNKVEVRCWELSYSLGKPTIDHLFITYPEDNNGHDLVTCLNCGELYAVTVAIEVYVGPPLAEKIKGIDCVNCGKPLDGNYAYYPDIYVVNGKQYTHERETELPSDSQSIIKVFYGIYE